MTLSKLQIKSITNLRLKKYRNLENKFLVEGEKAVRDGLNSGYDYELILATQEYLDKNPHTLKGNQKAEIIKNNDFQKITDTVNPQGIAAIFKKPGQKKDWTNNLNSELIVCLENISDPGNVGTIIRNCDWFGIKNIILSNTCADVYNPKTIRSSVGSLFHTNIFFSCNLLDDLNILKNKGCKILSSALGGKSVFNYKTGEKTIIILGNEANGISKNILSFSDNFITIPKIGNAESLNVANASAVILGELTK